jgi:5'-deoxy-5'-methylthioadenosine phosphorylase
MLGIIGGTGLHAIAGLRRPEGEPPPETPYGVASSALSAGRITEEGEEVCFLLRHGPGHTYAPHEVPYRANIWALREAGVTEIVAVNSVGSLRHDWGCGNIVLPDQIIDYTWGRELSFRQPGEPVVHLDFSHPYTEELRHRILDAAAKEGVGVFDGGTYGCTQGPRFETPAEIRRMAQDGCDIVGMTAMPEAYLAREAGLAYAAICVVGNLAAGLAGPAQVIVHEEIAAATKKANATAQRILARLSAAPPPG